MRVLVLGGGGREHALVWKLSQSELVETIWCYPGNAGIAQIARIPDMDTGRSQELADFAASNNIDLTVVGPEALLATGVVDIFRSRGLTIFGPTQKAAQLETSKAFAKALLAKYRIPTAAHRVCSDYPSARTYIETQGAPIVIKADGLAGGKGVTVAQSVEEALQAAKAALSGQAVGDAGRRIVVEECLQGPEVSILALCDGSVHLTLSPSQDHKRIGDGDTGPNTGGMGAYSPVPFIDARLEQEIRDSILVPTLDALHHEGIHYTGVLYAGLMLTAEGPKVIEFNCRFGDPETQVLLPRLRTDLAELLLAASQGRLQHLGSLAWDHRAAVCIIAASRDYPGTYKTGFPIGGLDGINTADANPLLFHAGTAIGPGGMVTAGGRVLGVTALGNNVAEARDKAYHAMERIHFQGMYYRKDIAWQAL